MQLDKNLKKRREPIEYLALEGGGGKGVAYLGAIVALEDEGILPLKPNLAKTKINAKDRKIEVVSNENTIKGISGASAGAITGLCLAMGMNSAQLCDVLTAKTMVWGHSQNVFSSFFDFPYAISYYKRTNQNGINMDRQGFSDSSIIYYIREINNEDGSSTYEHFKSSEKSIYDGQGYTGWLKGLAKSKIDPKNDPILNAMFGFTNKTKLKNSKKFDYHLKGLNRNSGLFPGLVARDFLRELLSKNLSKIDNIKSKIEDYNRTMWIKKQPTTGTLKTYTKHYVDSDTYILDETLIEMHKKHFFYNHINYYNLQNLTFEQFYFLTGVNFTVTGANITNKVSLYFSKDRTPDFPVVDAVLISMNLPGIFPPIWNKADVFQDDKQFSSVCNYNYKAYNSMYKGKYVDGGIMNNLPIHAFDDVKNVFEFYVDPRKPIKNEIFNKKVLGLRLTENKNHEDGVVNPEEDFALASSVEELLFSALQYSEEGKILSKEEREACVDLLTYELATTNFTPNQKQVQMPLVDAFGSVFTYLNGYVYRTPRRLRDMILKWDKV